MKLCDYGYWCIQTYADFDDEEGEQRSEAEKPIIAAVSVGFVVVGLVILAVGCYAYRKHKYVINTTVAIM